MSSVYLTSKYGLESKLSGSGLEISKLAYRAHFHLRFFHRSRAFPMPPPNSCMRARCCPEIATIEVGVVTTLIPPSTFRVHSTVVVAILIIISVVGCELHSVVFFQ